MANSRFRATLSLLEIALVFVSHVSSHCDPVENPGEGDNAIPDFFNYFSDHFTLLLEMTELKNNRTNYVKHSYYVGGDQGDMIETSAVAIHDEGTLIIYHYFPEEEKFVEQFDEYCNQPPEPKPSYDPGQWFDGDESHGVKMYGPATILRSTHFQKARYDGKDFDVDGVKCERWYICINEETEVDLYFSQRDAFDMPEKDIFKDERIANRLPVMFEVLPEDESRHMRYTVVDFFPDLDRHSNIETPRGLDCEDKFSLDPSRTVPKIPPHFSLAEEFVTNPFIDGILKDQKQFLDKYEMKYCEDISMVRLDLTPPAEERESDQYPDKIIHDFNTEIEYAINRRYGKCEMNSIPPYAFDKTHPGVIGGYGVMAGPNEMFHLDDTYAYVGPRETRSFNGELFTSTRSDIPDPETEFVMNYPKAALEYYFSKAEEEAPGIPMLKNIPTRGDLFIYNKTDQYIIDYMTTINYYDAKEVYYYSPEEFSVNECYDRLYDGWSFLYIFFPATELQFQAVAGSEYEFKHQIYFHLLDLGDISPTRIGSIDVSDGSSGMYANTSDSDTVIVAVKLMEMAPAYFGYRIPDDPLQTPGDDEPMYPVNSEKDCATLCSIEEKFECKSFHNCDRECYLSDNINAMGPQTKNFTCLHFIDNHENMTFLDMPSKDVAKKLEKTIQDGKFNFSIGYKKITVDFKAELSIHLETPDPLDPILRKFSLYEWLSTITDPDTTIETEDKTPVTCMSACLSWIDYKCETIVYNFITGSCHLYSNYAANYNKTRIKYSIDSMIYSRTYIGDYKMMLGGISINTTGPVRPGDNPEDCAWLCSNIDDFDCNSFEYCWDGGEHSCHLHVETFMDVSDGGNYSRHQKCVHFEKKAEEIFTMYPHEGMPNKYHKLVAQFSTADACAKLCLDDASETCQSYDFCPVCEEGDFDVCGSENSKGTNMCFLGDHHIGEPGLSLVNTVNCEHFSRDLFGDQDYASWIASQRKSSKPYTGGSMAGLAFGMIFLGIILVLGFIFIMVKVKPGTLPESISIGEVKSGLPRSTSGDKGANVTFGNITAGDSDI